MSAKTQTHKRIKSQKLFDTCKLVGKWKRIDKLLPPNYTSLEDGASVELSIIKANYTESFSFKKNSDIVIKDSILEFFEEDMLY
ncbi:hypothetical protein [Nitrosopumilus maritimus]|uniref:hypothetical protein n=1 Tax=Nitrosopumilus maritimus TaxID=338192 RepID=UPI0011E4EDBD|nr:hypothetical protein [Nitrosopumilus maritimus]